MKGKIGYWGSGVHGGLAVYFSAEMLNWLDGHNCGRKVFTTVTRNKEIIIIPDAAGGHVSSRLQKGVQWDAYVSCSQPGSLFLDLDLIPFELMTVEFKAEQDNLSYALPADHELPWPRLRECSTYEAEQLALEALQARMNSLIASGETSFSTAQKMPDRLRKLLPSSTWAECIRTARALSGINS